MNPIFRSVLCRLCLYRSEFLIDIFDENGKHGYIAARVIEDLLQFQVEREDGYPQQVCTKCLDKLTDFKLFRMQCSDARLTFDKEFSELRAPVDNPFPSSSEALGHVEVKVEKIDAYEDSYDVSSSKGLVAGREETVTDDYFPQKEALGHVEVKVEKIDAYEDSYDVDAPEGIAAEEVIKTESLDCDVSFDQGIVTSGDVGDGMVSSHVGSTGAYDRAGVGRIQVRSLWGAMVNSVPGPEQGSYAQDVNFPSLHIPQGGSDDLGSGSCMVQEPPPREEFVCPECGKSFAYLSYMNKHIRTTHNRELCERKHECEVCKMRFARRGNLERHQMVHKGVRSFSCDRCDKAFFHRSDLKAHTNSHIKDNSFTCDCCQKGFADKLQIIEHVSRHTGQKPFSCTSCGKPFGSIKYLKQHEKTHGPNPKFRCEECNKTFTNRVNFMGHQRKHNGEMLRCLECGKTFVHKYNLKQHEALHQENGGFTCDVCGKKFDKKSHLRVHMMLHTGERPYECEYCTKRFHVASHLRVHLKLHTGERSFYCDFCGKGFVQKCHYVNHLRVHTGERPFPCTECNRAFCQRQQLRQHMKTHEKGGAITTEAVG